MIKGKNGSILLRFKGTVVRGPYDQKVKMAANCWGLKRQSHLSIRIKGRQSRYISYTSYFCWKTISVLYLYLYNRSQVSLHSEVHFLHQLQLLEDNQCTIYTIQYTIQWKLCKSLYTATLYSCI